MQLTNRIFGLYVILTDPLAGYEQCARAAVKAGVRYIQLRMKNVGTREYIRTAKKVREITRGSSSYFIVNDILEVAIAAEADGLHLGQLDQPVDEARKEWKVPGRIFGLSTHNEEQAARAGLLEPDYIGVGPVFPTPAKAVPDPVLGVERMGAIIRSSSLPAVAIGGINKENLAEVFAHGAVNFSAVRPVTQSPDPYQAIMELQRLWNSAGASR